MRSSSAAIRLLSLLLFLLLVSIITYWAMQLLAPRGAIAPNDAIGENGRPPAAHRRETVRCTQHGHRRCRPASH